MYLQYFVKIKLLRAPDLKFRIGDNSVLLELSLTVKHVKAVGRKTF